MLLYPQWVWTETLTEEQGRMILTLAWLVRVNNTEQTRTWLKQITQDFLDYQQPCGAVQEHLGFSGKCRACPPGDNDHYGSGEAPIIQSDGDTGSDLLYTQNFALLGLHEAAHATGDKYYFDAEDKLAEFLVRVQASSQKLPHLSGAWFRGFDYKSWEYWGSASDWGWGPWSVETGWTESWISSIFALRHLNTSIWDLSKTSGIDQLFKPLCSKFLPGYC